MAATRRRDPWIRWFDVTSPKKHSSGYTIYKVTSKVFPVHSPEATTEIVVWKRYKDIHKLHKTLSLVHRNLHRPAAFPDFPKPRIFGRFDDDIIEERRLAALELLNFIGSQPHLFNSLAVQEFFEASESREGEKPSHDQNILQPVSVAPAAGAEPLTSDSTGGEQEEQNTQEGEETTLQSQEGAQPTGDNPQDAAEFNPSSSVNGGDILTADGSLNTAHDTEESLSGIWAHRQTENSDGEQSECEQSDGEQSDGEQSDGEPIGSPSTAAQQLSQIAESDLRSDSDIMNEFDPYRGEGSPRQSEGVSNSQLLSQCVNESVDMADASQSSHIPDTNLLPPSDTLGEYIQSKEDYLYKAVKQIHRARREEQQSHYQIAFDYYKRAVALLLTGVQGDNDEGRRSVVKRKTAEYLVYAEQLHNIHLDSSGTDSDRWRQLQVPRSVARLREGLSELGNFKVLGLVGKNMLVLDKHSDQTFVIKVLQKNSEVTEATWAKQVIPTKCARMVKLVKYFETECTTYLLLEYAQGMTLWEYVYHYLHGSSRESSPRPLLPEGADNIYSGKKYTTTPAAGDAVTADIGIKEEQGSSEHVDISPPVEDVEQLSVEGGTKTSDTTNNTDINKESAITEDVFKVISTSDSQVSPASKEMFEESTPSSTRRNQNCDKVSLRRSNSSMSRSVSVERASDTVSSSRHRNWSTAFDDLDISSNQKHVRPHLPESCVQRWAAELLMAIHEIHQCGLILRDLSPGNILLNSRGHVILTYFCRWPGVRQELPSKSKENLYVSPEGTLPGALCLASDYWSFGVILYELLSGVSLSNAHPEGITSHTILRTPDRLSQEAEHLLKQLLRCNWKERLGGGAAGIDEIKAHPFFGSIDWSTV